MEKIAGHTMGTPELTIEEAMDLFRLMGLDGIEIVVQDDYLCGLPCNVSRERLEQVRNKAQECKLRVICLTPYYSRYNDLDDNIRRSEIEGLKKVIEYASFLGAEFVRIYGGSFTQEEQDPDGEKRRRFVEAMREAGDTAKKYGITLVVENHFNTMTVTAQLSQSIVGEIAHPNVGILYDQVNLAFVGGEDYQKAIALQKGLIRYVHAKDLVFKGENRTFHASSVSHVNEDERIVRSRIVGEGIMDWPGIVKQLRSIGYQGWYSLEYERRWHPQDLPFAATGMKRGADYLRQACFSAEPS